MGAVCIRAVHGHLGGVRAGEALVLEGLAHLDLCFPLLRSALVQHVAVLDARGVLNQEEVSRAPQVRQRAQQHQRQRQEAGPSVQRGLLAVEVAHGNTVSGEIQLRLYSVREGARACKSRHGGALDDAMNQTAYPIAPAFTGASGSSITLTHATVPLTRARSSAGRICAGSVTNSPWPPNASTTLS